MMSSRNSHLQSGEIMIPPLLFSTTDDDDDNDDVDNERTWFAFYSLSKQHEYYYEPKSKILQWEYPVDGTISDLPGPPTNTEPTPSSVINPNNNGKKRICCDRRSNNSQSSSTRSSTTTTTWFCFYSEFHQHEYFYEPKSGRSCWELPVNGIVSQLPGLPPSSLVDDDTTRNCSDDANKVHSEQEQQKPISKFPKSKKKQILSMIAFIIVILFGFLLIYQNKMIGDLKIKNKDDRLFSATYSQNISPSWIDPFRKTAVYVSSTIYNQLRIAFPHTTATIRKQLQRKKNLFFNTFAGTLNNLQDSLFDSWRPTMADLQDKVMVSIQIVEDFFVMLMKKQSSKSLGMFLVNNTPQVIQTLIQQTAHYCNNALEIMGLRPLTTSDVAREDVPTEMNSNKDNSKDPVHVAPISISTIEIDDHSLSDVSVNKDTLIESIVQKEDRQNIPEDITEKSAESIPTADFDPTDEDTVVVTDFPNASNVIETDSTITDEVLSKDLNHHDVSSIDTNIVEEKLYEKSTTKEGNMDGERNIIMNIDAQEIPGSNQGVEEIASWNVRLPVGSETEEHTMFLSSANQKALVELLLPSEDEQSVPDSISNEENLNEYTRTESVDAIDSDHEVKDIEDFSNTPFASNTIKTDSTNVEEANTNFVRDQDMVLINTNSEQDQSQEKSSLEERETREDKFNYKIDSVQICMKNDHNRIEEDGQNVNDINKETNELLSLIETEFPIAADEKNIVADLGNVVLTNMLDRDAQEINSILPASKGFVDTEIIFADNADDTLDLVSNKKVSMSSETALLDLQQNIKCPKEQPYEDEIPTEDQGDKIIDNCDNASMNTDYEDTKRYTKLASDNILEFQNEQLDLPNEDTRSNEDTIVGTSQSESFIISERSEEATTIPVVPLGSSDSFDAAVSAGPMEPAINQMEMYDKVLDGVSVALRRADALMDEIVSKSIENGFVVEIEPETQGPILVPESNFINEPVPLRKRFRWQKLIGW